jgi:hypothetical protein
MMDGFLATVEARDPSLGRMRSYRLEAGTDLFSAWLVDVVYGRIGTCGRRICYVAENEDKARKLARRNLRRRATARKRIGVGYRFRELIDLHGWCPSPFEQHSLATSTALMWSLCPALFIRDRS